MKPDDTQWYGVKGHAPNDFWEIFSDPSDVYTYIDYNPSEYYRYKNNTSSSGNTPTGTEEDDYWEDITDTIYGTDLSIPYYDSTTTYSKFDVVRYGAKNYTINDIIRYKGLYCRCIINDTRDITPQLKWQEISYSISDSVTYNDIWYICTDSVKIGEAKPGLWKLTDISSGATTYNNSTIYNNGDIVTYNSKYYECQENDVVGVLPTLWVSVNDAMKIAKEINNNGLISPNIQPYYGDIVKKSVGNSQIFFICKIKNGYSSSSIYNYNDIIKYNNKFYKCIESITVPEPFDSSNWVEIRGNLFEGGFIRLKFAYVTIGKVNMYFYNLPDQTPYAEKTIYSDSMLDYNNTDNPTSDFKCPHCGRLYRKLENNHSVDYYYNFDYTYVTNDAEDNVVVYKISDMINKDTVMSPETFTDVVTTAFDNSNPLKGNFKCVECGTEVVQITDSDDSFSHTINGAFWTIRAFECFNGFYGNHTPTYNNMFRNNEITYDIYDYILKNTSNSIKTANMYVNDLDSVKFTVPDSIALIPSVIDNAEPWNESTAYVQNDVVYYEQSEETANNDYYVCLENNEGITPDSNAEYWQKINTIPTLSNSNKLFQYYQNILDKSYSYENVDTKEYPLNQD